MSESTEIKSPVSDFLKYNNEIINLLNKWSPIVPSPETDPIEIFDKHPITLMQRSSNDTATNNDPDIKFLRVSDHWKTFWHSSGVQVPVKVSNHSKKAPFFRIHRSLFKSKSFESQPIGFELPESYVTKDAPIYLSRCRKTSTGTIGNQAPCMWTSVGSGHRKHRILPVRYQLDRLDYAWMETENEERECMGLELMKEWHLERILDMLERLCMKKMRRIVNEIDNKSLEFDENAKCDVCQSREGEEGNELVFCEECFLCVHQACYGIENLPKGSWVCKRCELRAKPSTACVLCPNTGGAMKLTIDKKWCHVSCALWIPEVSFGSVELMEPILGTNAITPARKKLLCTICNMPCGACIQCAHGRCRIAFHFTCAVQNGQATRHVLLDNGRDISLQAYCEKHTRMACPEALPDTFGQISSLSAEDARRKKLNELEASFWRQLKPEDLHWALESLQPPVHINREIQASVTTYWRLKRRSQHNRACLPAIHNVVADELLSLDPDLVLDAREQLRAFTRMRFTLDQARLMLDMVKRREKLKLKLIRNIAKVSRLQLNLAENYAEDRAPVPFWISECLSTKTWIKDIIQLNQMKNQSINTNNDVNQSVSNQKIFIIDQIPRDQLLVSEEISKQISRILVQTPQIRHLFTFEFAKNRKSSREHTNEESFSESQPKIPRLETSPRPCFFDLMKSNLSNS